MQLIGFNLKKMFGERDKDYKRGAINTNMEFTDVAKEKVDFLKDEEALRISFTFSITYSDPDKKEKKLAEVAFEGDMALTAEKDEMTEMLKDWKKKQIADNYRIPLINFIIKKCSTKALLLEEDLNLPAHIPFPQIRKEKKES